MNRLPNQTFFKRLLMPHGDTISQKLVQSRWDNHILTLTWLALATIGSFGVYATLDQESQNIEGNLPHNMVAHRPPRARRRDMQHVDTLAGNGITGNILVAGY